MIGGDNLIQAPSTFILVRFASSTVLPCEIINTHEGEPQKKKKKKKRYLFDGVHAVACAVGRGVRDVEVLGRESHVELEIVSRIQLITVNIERTDILT